MDADERNGSEKNGRECVSTFVWNRRANVRYEVNNHVMENIKGENMDYLFYGKVAISKEEVQISIGHDDDEPVNVYLLERGKLTRLSGEEIQGTYRVKFPVSSSLRVLCIYARSNEIDEYIAASYAIDEYTLISLPDNEVISLTGAATILYEDGSIQMPGMNQDRDDTNPSAKANNNGVVH